MHLPLFKLLLNLKSLSRGINGVGLVFVTMDGYRLCIGDFWTPIFDCAALHIRLRCLGNLIRA